MLRDPAGEALAEPAPEQRQVDLLVRADDALERERHDVAALDQVDPGVVVVDDPARLLDDRPADGLDPVRPAQPARGRLQHAELGGPLGGEMGFLLEPFAPSHDRDEDEAPERDRRDEDAEHVQRIGPVDHRVGLADDQRGGERSGGPGGEGEAAGQQDGRGEGRCPEQLDRDGTGRRERDDVAEPERHDHDGAAERAAELDRGGSEEGRDERRQPIAGRPAGTSRVGRGRHGTLGNARAHR